MKETEREKRNRVVEKERERERYEKSYRKEMKRRAGEKEKKIKRTLQIKGCLENICNIG